MHLKYFWMKARITLWPLNRFTDKKWALEKSSLFNGTSPAWRTLCGRYVTLEGLFFRRWRRTIENSTDRRILCQARVWVCWALPKFLSRCCLRFWDERLNNRSLKLIFILNIGNPIFHHFFLSKFDVIFQ